MKKLAIALLFCGAAAFAGTVTYSTTGAFGGPDLSGGNLVNGGAMIVYTGGSYSVDAPSNINIGNMTTSGGTGTFVAGDTFTLTITQSVPTAGSATSSTSVTGTILSNSSGVNLTFSPTTFSIGQITYILESSYFLVPPVTNDGVTSIQANVTTPEPASLGLLGASLFAFGLTARRRLAK
jgi:hypothetical protein